MATITAAANYPVSGAFATTPAYSGTVIPAIWSAKLNKKFYQVSTFADVCNRDWEGEIKSMGDKVIINTAPTISSSPYTVGTALTYGVPTPNTQELNIDRGRYYAFKVSDVLEWQSKLALNDMFSTDAAQQMRIGIDSNCWYSTFTGADAANKGATAGVNSAAYDLGTDAAPITLTGGASGNVLTKILELASVLDEQNVPDDDRFIVIDPKTRTLLLQSPLAQAYITGDDTSPLRNGLIGTIDRFKVYVSNLLPRAAAGANSPWLSGDGSQNTIASTSALARKAIIAGHRSAMTFASQITKTETLPNHDDFGTLVRSLNVYGVKTVQPKALALLVAAP